MDSITIPYKVRYEEATYQGDWTAEDIDAGHAGTPTVVVHEEWYEPTENGPRLITDGDRIRALEAGIAQR